MDPRSVDRIYVPPNACPLPLALRQQEQWRKQAQPRGRVPWRLVCGLVVLAVATVWAWWPLAVAP